MTTQKYVDIINGEQYDLPATEPSNGFREGVYNTTQAAATGTTSRIRALLYVWQYEALKAIPTTSNGPFYNSGDIKELSAAQKDVMRFSGTITVLSDSGYASDFDSECSDNPTQIDPWATLENVFTYDPDGGGSRSFMTRYFVPTITNNSQTNKCDIWQIQSTDYGEFKGNVVICSDVFHIIGPTRYQQDEQAGTGEKSQLDNLSDRFSSTPEYETYSQVKTAFQNLYGITEPGGFLIFSVPYDGDPADTTGDPVELAPFPTSASNNTQKCYLWDWNFGETNNEDVIQNTPRGQTTSEEVDGLIFTRSINCPPVLRTFTKGALQELLTKAQDATTGVTNIKFHALDDGNYTNINEFGIYWNATITTTGGGVTWTASNTPTNGTLQSKSLIVTAQRPAAP